VTAHAVIASEAKQSSAREARQSKTLLAASPRFLGAPTGAKLDCFAIGGAKRRRSSNGYGSQ
jgi:hypothetical protein